MRVLSRTGLGVALLFIGLFLFYAALLNVRVTDAQTGGGTSGGTTGGGSTSDGACTNSEAVATFSASAGENLTNQTFQVSGDRFRVAFENEGTGFASVGITINDKDGDFVDNFVAGGEERQTSLIVNQGPGRFSLDTIADTDNDYTVTVEDCGESGQGGGTTDEDTDDDGVIDKTIPKKPLPDTGGSTALMVGGSALLLLYGGLVAWRLKTRER